MKHRATTSSIVISAITIGLAVVTLHIVVSCLLLPPYVCTGYNVKEEIRVDAPTLVCWQNGSESMVDITFPHGVYVVNNTVEAIIGDLVALDINVGGGQTENWGAATRPPPGYAYLEVCEWEDTSDGELLTDCPHEVNELPAPSFTLQQSLGFPSQSPPSVRARVRSITLDTMGNMNYYWSDWSNRVSASTYQAPIIEIAAVIGVAGIAVAVVNNYWSGRQQRKATEVTRAVGSDERFMELYDASRETEFQRTMGEVLYLYEWTDYADFQSKYGPQADLDAWAKIQSLTQYFEGLGVLVEEGSVSVQRVARLLDDQIIAVWEKLEAIIMDRRKREMNPKLSDSFEALYYAIKKQEQQLDEPTDDVRVHKFED
ncbi:MAG: hypothetical protein JSV76_00580 [Candidatus Bathyarchaeota archaeon]|nr:MAG: hypothetical protein JSV76_00580 [Candidatus Bathyarchaeota archaeon]